MKIAIAGFRHEHMIWITQLIKKSADLEIVAVAEDQPQACADYLKAAGLTVTHKNLEDMLNNVEFDILAIGDIYAKRGIQAIKALVAGKHILSDKPLCTHLDEINEIYNLSKAKTLSVFVLLSERYTPVWQTARRLLRVGAIGKVATISVFGYHILSYRSGRPDWYFEAGQQGGTINDLMVHGIDALSWLTGHPIVEVIAARAWNATLPQVPFFQDAAQALLRLENNAGAMLDCSYQGAKGHPNPWIFDFWGTKGHLRVDGIKGVILQLHGEPEQQVEVTYDYETNFLLDFLAEIRKDKSWKQILTTEESLESTKKALLVQKAADENITNLRI